MAQTIPFPTPADVKAQPFSPVWLAAFAAIPDDRIQTDFINNVATLFGSAEVQRHTQRNEAVLYGATHLLALRLMAEGLISDGGGGGGLAGPLSSVKLDGVGSKSFAVAAWAVEDLSNWLKQKSPWLSKLLAILATFPSAIYVLSPSSDSSFVPITPLGCYY